MHTETLGGAAAKAAPAVAGTGYSVTAVNDPAAMVAEGLFGVPWPIVSAIVTSIYVAFLSINVIRGWVKEWRSKRELQKQVLPE